VQTPTCHFHNHGDVGVCTPTYVSGMPVFDDDATIPCSIA